MKKLCLLFTALILVCFAVCPAFAAAKRVQSVSFHIGDDYTLHTEEQLLESSDVEGLIFAAISKDGKHQIQCRAAKTDFSLQMGSFDGLDKTTVKPAADIIFPDGSDAVILNSTLYLKSVELQGEDSRVIYVTVTEGKLYTFTYFGPDPTVIGEFMSTVSLPKADSSSDTSVYMIILISVFIAADVVFLVFIILSFVKDYKQRKMEQSENIVSNYIKIKRRKY